MIFHVYSGDLFWGTYATRTEAQACIAYQVRVYGRMNMRIAQVT